MLRGGPFLMAVGVLLSGCASPLLGEPPAAPTLARGLVASSNPLAAEALLRRPN